MLVSSEARSVLERLVALSSVKSPPSMELSRKEVDAKSGELLFNYLPREFK